MVSKLIGHVQAAGPLPRAPRAIRALTSSVASHRTREDHLVLGLSAARTRLRVREKTSDLEGPAPVASLCAFSSQAGGDGEQRRC